MSGAEPPGGRRSCPRGRAAVCLGALALGCASQIDGRFPELARVEGHRLGDAHPYFLFAGGLSYQFLCRWDQRDPVSVSLPPDATADERALLEAALAAWEGAGLGLRFARRDAAPVDIEIRFVGADQAAGAGHARSGTTVVDCAVSPTALDGRVGAVLPAELARASIQLSRANLDVRGEGVRLSREELAGSALHELGHALGFQGHARHGNTVMLAEFEAVRRAGAKLLAGEPFGDPSLRALYALPSGSVLRRSALSADPARLVQRMIEAARRADLLGPFARVGDHSARLVWRDRVGASYALVVIELRSALRNPERLVLLPNANARAALAQR